MYHLYERSNEHPVHKQMNVLKYKSGNVFIHQHCVCFPPVFIDRLHSHKTVAHIEIEGQSSHCGTDETVHGCYVKDGIIDTYHLLFQLILTESLKTES